MPMQTLQLFGISMSVSLIQFQETRNKKQETRNKMCSTRKVSGIGMYVMKMLSWADHIFDMIIPSATSTQRYCFFLYADLPQSAWASGL